MPRQCRFAVIVSLLLAVVQTAALAQTCDPGVRGALNFDGVNDFVHVPTNAALDGMSDFTFEMWFRATPSGPVFRSLLDKGGSLPYLVGIYANPTVFLDGTLVVQAGPNVRDNVWHHFAVVASGPTVTLFLDGAPFAIGSYANPLGTSAADLYIGAAYSGSGTTFFDHWSGGIDEIRIWNVARTPAQIEGNRLYTLTGSEPGLVAYYKCDAASGQVLVNSATATGAALDGTLGPTTNGDPQDPTFTTADFTPMFYCVSGTGQPNSVEARLQVNGLGGGVGPGPFNVNVTGGANLTLSWNGPANAPLILALGPLNTNNFNFGCVGKIDLGSPPFYADVDFLMDGLNYPGSLFYVLSAAGTATQVYSVPQSAAGLTATLQGVVVQPVGSPCPLVLTAAFRVAIL